MSQYNDKPTNGGWNLPEYTPPQAVKSKIDASLNHVRFAGQVIESFIGGIGGVITGFATVLGHSPIEAETPSNEPNEKT